MLLLLLFVANTVTCAYTVLFLIVWKNQIIFKLLVCKKYIYLLIFYNFDAEI